MPKVCPVCGAAYSDANAFCPVDGSTLRALDLAESLIGSVIADRYLVTDLLGEGGMGRVYLARHVRLPQQAAIKVLHPELVRDPAAVARFNREASNASRIEDEHVARVYDFGETSDATVYIAMEYVAGRTLKRILVENGPLAPDRAVAIVRQIAEALDAAHRLGIVHRDLKPDNVLVAEGPDGRDRVKVVDFGIAKALGSNEGATGLTRTGFIVGTPDFMSPEQFMGGTVDARSDVYALALVAYQCLTGALPFDTTTPERAMAARLTAPPRRLLEVRPAVPWPAEVQAAFDAALARDAAERTESAMTFARQLRDAVRDWLGLSEGTSRFSTALAAPLAGATRVPRRVSRARDSLAAERPPRRAAGRAVIVAVVLVGVAAVAAVALRERGRHAVAVEPTSDSARVTPPITPAAASSLGAPGAPAAPAAPRAKPPAASAAAPETADSAASSRRPTGEPAAARRPGGAPSEETLAARQTLDSLGAVLREHDDVATARAVATELAALIPRLANADDRLRARMRLIDARVLSGDVPGACATLQAAIPTARTGGQRAEVRRYAEQLGCGG